MTKTQIDEAAGPPAASPSVACRKGIRGDLLVAVGAVESSAVGAGSATSGDTPKGHSEPLGGTNDRT